MAFVQGSSDLVRGIAPSPLVRNPGESLSGADCVIAPDVTLVGGTALGNRVVVAASANVDGSVVLDDAVIEQGASVRNCVVGKGVRIGAGTSLDGVAVGDGANIGERNELTPGARVWPGVTLPDCAVRYSSDA